MTQSGYISIVYIEYFTEGKLYFPQTILDHEIFDLVYYANITPFNDVNLSFPCTSQSHECVYLIQLIPIC